MSFGIRPTVDFVFKLLFGSSGNVDLLMMKGDFYGSLRPAISICFLMKPLHSLPAI